MRKPLGRLFLSVASATIACGCGIVLAVDDSQKFIEGLQQRRYLDTAAEFLEGMTADPNLSADAKRALPYEQALFLIDGAVSIRDPQARDAQLDDAQTKLKSFLAANPDHELAPQARARLANVLRFRAAALWSQADDRGADRAKLRAGAQAMYAEACKTLIDSAKRLRAKLDALPKDEQSAKTREEIGSQWLGNLLDAARTTFDMALTAEPKSEQRKKWVADAADQFSAIYQKYPKRLAGSYARYYEGQCYEELGERVKALAAYDDLMVDLLDADVAFRPLKTQAMRRAQQLWLDDKDYTTIVEKSLSWAKSARGEEANDTDWLAVKLNAARGLAEQSAKPPKSDPKGTASLREARQLAGEVAKSKNTELQADARQLLTRIERGNFSAQAANAPNGKDTVQFVSDTSSNAGGANSAAPTAAESKNFDSAFDRASEAVDEFTSIQAEITQAREEKQPDEKKIKEFQAKLNTKRDEAFANCRRALQLANDKVDAERLNQIRYFVCYFHYLKENYDEAVVVGDFLVKRYPDFRNSRQAALVALTSLNSLYRERKQAGDADLSFETDQIVRLADEMIRRWPSQPEASRALEMLIGFDVSSGQLSRAQSAVAKLPADSAGRTEAELTIGRALWSKYVHAADEDRQQKAVAAKGEQANVPDAAAVKQKLDTLMSQARESLDRGIQAAQKAKSTSDSAALGALALVQLYVTAGENEKAVALLEDSTLGPLVLLKKKIPILQIEGVPADIYRQAMRAYIAAEPQQLDKASAAMESLEKIYSTDKDSSAKFTQFLMSVAGELQQQFDDLKASGDIDRATNVAKAFDKFLSRIASRGDSADFKMLNWIALTYENMATSLDETAKAGTATRSDAIAYHRGAVNACEKILSRAESDKDFAPADKLVLAKLLLAKAYRGAADYEKAIPLFAAILKERPNALNVQIDAAKTFQKRGDSDPEYYVAALKGGTGDLGNIWGWGQLAKKTMKAPQFRDIFHEARYNVALCRKKFAESQTDAAKKRQLLEYAKDDIHQTKEFEPTLGDGKWKPQNEKLLREIQKSLGQPVIGLVEFDPKIADDSSSEGKK